MSGRYFWAIDLEPEVKNRISEEVKALQTKFSGARWVKPSNYHLTLLFMGEQEDKVITGLSKGARELAASQRPFTIVLNGLGFFPNPKRARVMYIGVSQGAGTVSGLAGYLHDLAKIQETDSYYPHLTVARFRQPPKQIDNVEFAPIKASVRELILFSSTLKPAGPVYRAVDKFSLSGIARGE